MDQVRMRSCVGWAQSSDHVLMRRGNLDIETYIKECWWLRDSVMAVLGNNTPYHVGYLCAATHPLKKARGGVSFSVVCQDGPRIM